MEPQKNLLDQKSFKSDQSKQETFSSIVDDIKTMFKENELIISIIDRIFKEFNFSHENVDLSAEEAFHMIEVQFKLIIDSMNTSLQRNDENESNKAKLVIETIMEKVKEDARNCFSLKQIEEYLVKNISFKVGHADEETWSIVQKRLKFVKQIRRKYGIMKILAVFNKNNKKMEKKKQKIKTILLEVRHDIESYEIMLKSTKEKQQLQLEKENEKIQKEQEKLKNEKLQKEVDNERKKKEKEKLKKEKLKKKVDNERMEKEQEKQKKEKEKVKNQHLRKENENERMEKEREKREKEQEKLENKKIRQELNLLKRKFDENESSNKMKADNEPIEKMHKSTLRSNTDSNISHLADQVDRMEMKQDPSVLQTSGGGDQLQEHIGGNPGQLPQQSVNELFPEEVGQSDGGSEPQLTSHHQQGGAAVSSQISQVPAEVAVVVAEEEVAKAQ